MLRHIRWLKVRLNVPPSRLHTTQTCWIVAPWPSLGLRDPHTGTDVSRARALRCAGGQAEPAEGQLMDGPGKVAEIPFFLHLPLHPNMSSEQSKY